MSRSELDSDIYSKESVDNEKGKEMKPKEFFSVKELCYYTRVDKFFKRKCSRSDLKLMIKIIDSKCDISLRSLDWFAAKFSKNRDKLNFVSGKLEQFDVRISYDSQLKSFRKKYFDPFRRKKKFYYHYDKKNKAKRILTTIGQLNFFRWAIDYGILDFVKENLEEINEEMRKSIQKEKDKEKKRSRAKATAKKNNKKNNKKSSKATTENSRSSGRSKRSTRSTRSNRSSKSKRSKKKDGEIKVKVKKTEDDDNAEIILHFS